MVFEMLLTGEWVSSEQMFLCFQQVNFIWNEGYLRSLLILVPIQRLGASTSQD